MTQANKMVSKANRQLAETEEELRMATEQKEALKGALRIVEGENGALRGVDEMQHGAGGRGKQNLEGVKDKQELGEKNAQDGEWKENPRRTVEPGEKSKAGVSYSPMQEPSQPHSTPLPNRSSPTPPHIRPTIPAVTIMDPHPATTGNKGSFWSPVTPLSDAGEGAGGSTPTTSSLSPVSTSHSPSPTTSWKAHSTGSPADSPNTEAAIHSPMSHLTVADPHIPGHRWPAAPRSRDAVRNELEDAMRRMQEMVGESEGEGESEGVMGSDVRKAEEDRESHAGGESRGKNKRSVLDAPRLDGGVNPWRT
jgi:hypothetical protein